MHYNDAKALWKKLKDDMTKKGIINPEQYMPHDKVERLPWTRFRWAATSCGNHVVGISYFAEPPLRDTVVTQALQLALSRAVSEGQTWDAFNVDLIVTPDKGPDFFELQIIEPGIL